MDEAEANLATLATACAFADAGSGLGVVTINMAAGEYALVARTVDGTSLLVNGTACGLAAVTNTSRINITGSPDAGAGETVILDYLNGNFALGTASSPGISIDLKAGTDALKVRASSAADTIYLATVTADAGASGVYAIGLTAAAAKNVVFNNVESLVVSTGPGADTVYTNGKADAGIGGSPFGRTTTTGGPTLTFYGGDENDTLNMGAAIGGAVTFWGGAGVDTAELSARTGTLTMTLGTGTHCEATETCNFKDDVEAVNAGSGNDTLTCASTSDAGCALNGGSGNDVLTGGPNNDNLVGGAGNDSIIGGTGDDTLDCGSGTDSVSYAGRTTAVVVSLDGGTGGETSLTEADVILACENVVGGDSDDTIVGNDSDNVITGGDGNDTLHGGAGNDTFNEAPLPDGGVTGNDTIVGDLGEDKVDYSARTTALDITLDGTTASGATALSEADILDVEDVLGGSAADTITGNASDNVIEGGAGDDTINALGGNDVVDPGPGTNDVSCGDGNDILLPGGTTPNALGDCEP